MTQPTIDRPGYYEVPDTWLTRRGAALYANAPDLIDALALNFNLGCVLKYVVRQGRKPNTPALVDLRKARDCLQREIERLERGGDPCGLGPELGDDDA